jgi:murein DD-endopeptidase MepM/ murein hydrolase activator NlpD
MQTGLQKAKRAVIATYLVVIHLVLAYFVGERVIEKYVLITPVASTNVPGPAVQQSIPTPLPVQDEFADPSAANTNTLPLTESSSSPGIIIPVAGVKPEQLIDTFSASRSEERYHDAIDIPAAAGTPVIAATDGEIVRFWDSERGGITIYQLTPDRKFVLYYAHLQRRADDIHEGIEVKKGATIAYVGDTGNAGAGNYHLHFSIARITDPKRIWEGSYLNPFPILKSGSFPEAP